MWNQKRENIIKMIVIFLVVILGVGSVYFLGDDNPVEEIAEEIIEEETGIKIDLTPSDWDIKNLKKGDKK
jgi:uncharacterized protein YpmB